MVNTTPFNLTRYNKAICETCGEEINIYTITFNGGSNVIYGTNHRCNISRCNLDEEYAKNKVIHEEKVLKQPQKWKNKFNKKVPKWQKKKY